MRYSLFGLVCLVLVFASCTNPAPTPPEKVPVPPASMFMEREYHFSSEQMRDKFLIGYYGPDVLDTTVHLIVLSFAGDTLYHRIWPGIQLLDSTYLTSPDSLKQVQAKQAMQDIIERKSADSLAAAFVPPLAPNAFLFHAGEAMIALEWSAAKKAVVAR